MPVLCRSRSGYPSPQRRRRTCPPGQRSDPSTQFPRLSMISGRHLRVRHPVVGGGWALSSLRPPPTNCRRGSTAGEACGGSTGSPHKTSTTPTPDVRNHSKTAMGFSAAARPCTHRTKSPSDFWASESGNFEFVWLLSYVDAARQGLRT